MDIEAPDQMPLVSKVSIPVKTASSSISNPPRIPLQCRPPIPVQIQRFGGESWFLACMPLGSLAVWSCIKLRRCFRDFVTSIPSHKVSFST